MRGIRCFGRLTVRDICGAYVDAGYRIPRPEAARWPLISSAEAAEPAPLADLLASEAELALPAPVP